MDKHELSLLVTRLAGIYINDNSLFEVAVREERGNLSVDDLSLLCNILHEYPAEPSDVDKSLLGLSGWMVICLHVVFELIYLLGTDAFPVLESIAFGEYDWPQSKALVGICRLYLDGKIPSEMIGVIDFRLKEMRYETQLNFVEELLVRQEQDFRFDQILQMLKSDTYQQVLAELIPAPPMTKEELIVLGNKITAAGESPERLQELMLLFDEHVPYPQGSSLFYYPHGFDGEMKDLLEYNPSVEEVVDRCMSYKGE